MERNDFKESITHGTVMFPLAYYKWDGDYAYTVNLHWHDEMEIIYFKKGTFSFRLQSTKHTIEGPAFAFISGGDSHAIVLEEMQQESSLVFDLRMLSFEHYDETQATIITPLMDKKLLFPSFVYPEVKIWDQLVQVYEKTLAEAQKNTVVSHMKVKACLFELIALLYEHDLMQMLKIDRPNGANIEIIHKVQKYVQVNYRNKIMVKDIADHVGLNEQYLCRYFKKATGTTLTEYMNNLRIERASGMLSRTQEKIIHIAADCGYMNIGHFINQFKEVKGMTPQDYRKLNSNTYSAHSNNYSGHSNDPYNNSPTQVIKVKSTMSQ